MGSAAASRTIKFIQKAGTYSATIMSPDGDLYQEYDGNSSNVGTIYPDFATLQPILYFVCTSSRVSEGLVTPDAMQYYFNGQLISWNGVTSTGVFAGFFQKISPTEDNPYYGLKILKNIVELSGLTSAVVKMTATVSYGTQTDQISATYNIQIGQSTGTSYRVTIAAGDTNNFVIRAKGGQCILKAMVYKAGTTITSGVTYQWSTLQNGVWTDLTGKTAQTLTVAEADINTYGEYRVTALVDGAEVGTDVQGVMDASDPYDIIPGAVPEDETIYMDESGNGEVTYTPKVVTRGTTTKALDTTFYFVVMDAAGVYLNSASDRTTAMTSYSVKREHCAQAGGDVTLVITSKD
jgi:hypothetical protein